MILLSPRMVKRAKFISYREADQYFINEAKASYNIKKRLNFEEYESIINTSGQRYELINGKLYRIVSPSFNHKVIFGKVFKSFLRCLHRHPCRPLTSPLDIGLKGHLR